MMEIALSILGVVALIILIGLVGLVWYTGTQLGRGKARVRLEDRVEVQEDWDRYT